MTNEERNTQMAYIVQEQIALALGRATMEKIEAQAAATIFSQELQAQAQAQSAELAPVQKVQPLRTDGGA